MYAQPESQLWQSWNHLSWLAMEEGGEKLQLQLWWWSYVSVLVRPCQGQNQSWKFLINLSSLMDWQMDCHGFGQSSRWFLILFSSVYNYFVSCINRLLPVGIVLFRYVSVCQVIKNIIDFLKIAQCFCLIWPLKFVWYISQIYIYGIFLIWQACSFF